jgi:hypothetical protein
MAEITTYISVLTLNVNELNSLIRRHSLAKWIKKEYLKYVVYKKPPILTKKTLY